MGTDAGATRWLQRLAGGPGMDGDSGTSGSSSSSGGSLASDLAGVVTCATAAELAASGLTLGAWVSRSVLPAVALMTGAGKK